MSSSFQVVDDFLLRLLFLALDEHFHLAFLGPDHHGLLAHPPHHVERRARLPSQRQFQHVLLNAALDNLPQFLGNDKEAIGGTQPVQRLVGPLVVVVLHP
jgi:hypothetical protein